MPFFPCSAGGEVGLLGSCGSRDGRRTLTSLVLDERKGDDIHDQTEPEEDDDMPAAQNLSH